MAAEAGRTELLRLSYVKREWSYVIRAKFYVNRGESNIKRDQTNVKRETFYVRRGLISWTPGEYPGPEQGCICDSHPGRKCGGKDGASEPIRL